MTYIDPEENVSDPPKSEQTKEIENILNPPEKSPPPKTDADEWGIWEYQIQASVDKLLNESRMFKLGIAAAAGVAAIALGATALTAKTMASLMGAIKQLGENQIEIANAIGFGQPTPGPSDVATNDRAADGMPVVAYPDTNGVDPTIDPTAIVGEPHMGPVTEASETVQKQLAEDQKAGIADVAKGEEPV